jgi:glycosyltransferase involved in cell wall biosynthesis
MKGVYFYRHQASDDLPSFYGLAEAFVLPSESEEWGLVVNEAMACGVPVVVSSKCGCAPDLVRPGVNGFQFNYDNPEELAMRMIEIGSQPDLARKMGRSSLEMISKWDWTLFLRNVECAVESVCTRPNGQA